MAVDGVRAEALGATQKVTFRDTAFTVSPPDEWLLDFLHYSDRAQVTRALEAMLGTAEYERFRTLTPRPKMSELEGFMSSVLSAFGVDSGN